MHSEWRLVVSQPSDGASNMALDEALMLHSASTPTLRLYAWSPACLSIGYSQSVARDVDTEACARLGIGLVRRPTGGGAILHDLELTYSVMAPETHPAVSGNILESYRKLSQCLMAGLALLGLRCELSPREEAAQRGSPACFQSPSAYELKAGGKKVVGSAQWRKGGALLQHGSLPLEIDRGRILDVLRPPQAEMYSMGDGRFLAGATSLSEALRRPVGFEETCEAVRAGFRDTLDIDFETGEPTSEERGLALELIQDKYASPAWTMMR